MIHLTFATDGSHVCFTFQDRKLFLNCINASWIVCGREIITDLQLFVFASTDIFCGKCL